MIAGRTPTSSVRLVLSPVRAWYEVAIPGFASYDQAPPLPVVTIATCLKPESVNARA